MQIQSNSMSIIMFSQNQTITSQISKCASQTDLIAPYFMENQGFSPKFASNSMTEGSPRFSKESPIFNFSQNLSECYPEHKFKVSDQPQISTQNSIDNQKIYKAFQKTPVQTPIQTPIQTPTQTTFKMGSPPKRQKPKLSRKNRPCNLLISTNISTFTDHSLHSMSPPPTMSNVVTSRKTASKITENLVLGSENDACDPKIYKKFNITKVLSIMSEDFGLPESLLENLPESHNINHKFIKLNDTTCSNISDHFREAIEFMEGEEVCLVHCRAGISRSSTLIMAYLIKKNKWSLNEAFTFTKGKRGCVAPNFGFLGQLQKFEEDGDENGEVASGIKKLKIDSR